MRFLAITLIVHGPDPVTGAQKSTVDRYREVVANARLAEELGFDGFGVGERHERPFISSSPPVVLSHLAALTSRIRLFTAVTTGSSGGESATVAGHNGLRFAANYHVSPATVLEAVRGYRAAFQPSAELARPYVSVSADVVVADDEATARELATGYGPWVRSIRTGAGAIPFPTPEEAQRIPWTHEDRALVADRVDTQFVGTAAQVADKLAVLRDATGADELIITTITHDHADRARSYQLLAEEWGRR
jgi:alkanesulfonate monooxygenase SsuD/methylene tetrahydromethanopterin reductase-like flavin-dependent oxidoreductase (luciferase family)